MRATGTSVCHPHSLRLWVREGARLPETASERDELGYVGRPAVPGPSQGASRRVVMATVFVRRNLRPVLCSSMRNALVGVPDTWASVVSVLPPSARWAQCGRAGASAATTGAAMCMEHHGGPAWCPNGERRRIAVMAEFNPLRDVARHTYGADAELMPTWMVEHD